MAKREETPDVLGDILGGTSRQKQASSLPTDKKPEIKENTQGIELKKNRAGRKTLYIDVVLWKRLLIYAKENDTSASEIIESLVENFLKTKT